MEIKIFPNLKPLSPECQGWIDSELRPDAWMWHYPQAGDICHNLMRPMPDDYDDAFIWLVIWLINEAAFDQLYRRPQVSHLEYQHVADWCLRTGKESNLIVPAHLTGCTVVDTLDGCGWFGLHWSRYPDFIIDGFNLAGWTMRPAYPHNDPRHPEYKKEQSKSPKFSLLELSSPD